MRDDFDIEDVFKRNSGEPSPRVKREVLSAFRKAFGSAESGRHTVGLWKRPVPFYMFAASLALFMALSFYAGKSTSQSVVEPPASHESMREREMLETLEITWSITERDLL
jgi:hypothetical protein